jgi:hypothetical protein
MPAKKGTGKKGGFSLVPITLSEPVKTADGFTNLIDAPAAKPQLKKTENGGAAKTDPEAKQAKRKPSTIESKQPEKVVAETQASERVQKEDARSNEQVENGAENSRLTEFELLRILDADSLDEIFELTDVLRASSLKLYAALVRLADSRGRVRVKNHELMSKAGIKGIATLYKQERWLMDLKLLEKKAKPGPHDGSLYVIHRLETLPLPGEIFEKFDEYLSTLK